VGEFELIRRFFQRQRPPRADVPLGIGDDCALLVPAPGQQLAVSTDMLVEGRHFLSTVDPAALGHKALAVNLSDLAAMGAQPLGFTLALALPQADEAWLSGFARGLFDLADAHACELVGGDTTRGPLNLCLTVMGQVPPGLALKRANAQVGDDIFVSGTLGDARLALAVFRGEAALEAAAFARVRERMERPTPRLALGLALRGVAHAAADISDGLSGDLGHILRASAVGASLQADALLWATSDDLRASGEARALAYALTGGDDYELVFTAPPHQREAVAQAAAHAGVNVTRIGQIDAAPGLRLLDALGREQPLPGRAFDHFA
jgi:thiamine-monophosphate kinase